MNEQTNKQGVELMTNLPDFIIIGAQKAGTSALRFNLSKHPDIFTAKVATGNENRPFKNEINFFNSDVTWDKGISWYKSLFSEPDKIQGEKTPAYIMSEKAMQRMVEVAPNVKLILLLRNPVHRAYSQWNHHNQKLAKAPNSRWKIDTFENIISLSTQNISPFNSLINQGKYILQINKILKHFPREQLFFGITERFLNDPNRQLDKVLDFLGAERIDLKPQIRHKREYQENIKQETKIYLDTLFEPYNQQLFDFLGEEIVEWK